MPVGTKAFVHEVEALVHAGILAMDQAQPVLDAAADAIAELQGG